MKEQPKKVSNIVSGVTMFDLVRSQFRLKGEPYDFEGKDHLINIINDNPPQTVIMSGRQVEKSTTLSNKLGVNAVSTPKLRALYVGPVFKQVATFSKDRLVPLFSTSTPFVKDFISKKDGAKVSVTDITLTNYAYIALRSLYNDSVDSTRGLSNDIVCYDEVQDIVKDNIPVVNETLSHSFLVDPETGKRGRVIYTGTPKSRDNTIEHLWQSSTQDMLGFKCPRCGKWIIGGGIENIKEEGFACQHCRRIINLKEVSKEWIRSYERDKERPAVGYHISQLMMPWIPWNDVLDKFRGKAKYEDYRFFNEVLGYSYDNSEKVFTENEFKEKILSPITSYEGESIDSWDDMFEYANRFNISMFYIGNDWGSGGKSKTVTTIKAVIDNKLTPIFYKRYSSADEGHDTSTGEKLTGRELELYNIQKFMRIHPNSVLGVDYGDGYLEDQKLVKEFGLHRVFVIYHSDGLGALIKFDKATSKYVTNRTDIMSKYIREVESSYENPGSATLSFRGTWNMYSEMARDFIAVSREYRKSSGRIIYVHTDPDDSFHSAMYAYIAFLLKNQIVTPLLSSSEDEKTFLEQVIQNKESGYY